MKTIFFFSSIKNALKLISAIPINKNGYTINSKELFAIKLKIEIIKIRFGNNVNDPLTYIKSEPEDEIKNVIMQSMYNMFEAKMRYTVKYEYSSVGTLLYENVGILKKGK